MIDFNYKYDTNENMITLVGNKPESIAQFKFEDLDEGLVNKEAKDILDKYVDSQVIMWKNQLKVSNVKSKVLNQICFQLNQI